MKKLLGIVVLGLLLSTNAFGKPGKGELKLEPWAVDYFIKYLSFIIEQNERNKSNPVA